MKRKFYWLGRKFLPEFRFSPWQFHYWHFWFSPYCS